MANRDAHSAISIFAMGHKEMVQTTKSINKNLLASVRTLELSQEHTNRNCMAKLIHEQNNKNCPKLRPTNSKTETTKESFKN